MNFYLDPSVSAFLYENDLRIYYKTIQKYSFQNARQICVDMGGDLAIFGIQQNITRK